MPQGSLRIASLLAAVCAALAGPSVSFAGQDTAPARDAVAKEATADGTVGQITVTVGKSLIVDSPLAVTRIATAAAVVEAQAVSPKEILLNGKAPGETTLILWREDGSRLKYDLTVRPSQAKTNPDTRSNRPAEGK